jgi:hypothetical protein
MKPTIAVTTDSAAEIKSLEASSAFQGASEAPDYGTTGKLFDELRDFLLKRTYFTLAVLDCSRVSRFLANWRGDIGRCADATKEMKILHQMRELVASEASQTPPCGAARGRIEFSLRGKARDESSPA